jgi:hypothetical protein
MAASQREDAGVVDQEIDRNIGLLQPLSKIRDRLDLGQVNLLKPNQSCWCAGTNPADCPVRLSVISICYYHVRAGYR